MSSDAAVTFAIISNAPAASALLQSVCEELEKRSGRSITPLVLRSYDKLVNFMRAGGVHLAWAPPLIAIDLERETHARIRLCARRAGRLDYMSALFAMKRSGLVKMSDLVGKRIAWVAKESSAGYVVPRMQIAAEGLDPDAIFSEQTFRRTHEAVVRAVVSGEADVGATFASFGANAKQPATAGWLEASIPNEDVTVIATAGPIPSDVIAMSADLSEDTASLLSDALRDLGQPVKLLLGAESFEQPDIAHFDGLRKLVSAAASLRGEDKTEVLPPK